MSDILTRIADYKRDEVTERRRRITLDELEARAAAASPTRGFRAALERAPEPKPVTETTPAAPASAPEVPRSH